MSDNASDQTAGKHTAGRFVLLAGMIDRLIPTFPNRRRYPDFAIYGLRIDDPGILVQVIPGRIVVLLVCVFASGGGDAGKNQQRGCKRDFY